jgi:ComF family protein
MAKVLPQAISLKRWALDLLFPRWCLGCGKEGDFLCPSCQDTLPKIVPPLCPRCGSPEPGGNLCPPCAREPSALNGIRSPFRFEGLMREAIHQMKYRNLRALAEPLAQLLGDYLQESPVPGEVLVPVPLHAKRRRERGYNQSQLLARELGKLTGLPVVSDSLVRPGLATPQARTTGVRERMLNVADAFACRDERLKGRRVLLIDDVATSGATLGAAADALKKIGAESVWGLVLAREI